MNRDYSKSSSLKVILTLWAILIGAITSSGQVNFRVENTSQYLSNGLFNWKIFIKAENDLLKRIEFVEYRLDPSFRDPIKKVYKLGDSKYPFAFSGEALKAFNVGITVYVKNDKPMYSDYTLQLTREIAVTPQIRIRQDSTKRLDQTQFQGKVSISVGSIYARKRNTPFKIRIFENSSNKTIVETELASGDVKLNFNYDSQEYVLKGYTKAIGLGFDYLYCTVYRVVSR